MSYNKSCIISNTVAEEPRTPAEIHWEGDSKEIVSTFPGEVKLRLGCRRQRDQVKNGANKPTHITKGDVLDDLGLSRSEASALKVKATLLDAILREIETRGYTQNQLIDILDEHQPSVSNLVRGKIAKVSLEKLLTYSARLNMTATLTIQTKPGRHRAPRSASGFAARSRTQAGVGARGARQRRTATGR